MDPFMSIKTGAKPRRQNLNLKQITNCQHKPMRRAEGFMSSFQKLESVDSRFYSGQCFYYLTTVLSPFLDENSAYFFLRQSALDRVYSYLIIG